MTRETPSGWYPDPGQTSDGPATERWWDGRAWTDRIRPQQPASWAPPAAPDPSPAAPDITTGADAPRAEGNAPVGKEPASGGEPASGSGTASGGEGPSLDKGPSASGATSGGAAASGQDAGSEDRGDSGSAAAGQRPAGAGVSEAASSGRTDGGAAASAASSADPAGTGQAGPGAAGETPGPSPAPGEPAGPGRQLPHAGQAAGAPYPPVPGGPAAAPYPPGAGHPSAAPFPPGAGHPSASPYPPGAPHPPGAAYPPGAPYPPGGAYPPGAGYPAAPGHPVHPGGASPRKGRGLRIGAAVAAAVVVLAGIGVGTYALTADDGSGGPSATSRGPGGNPGEEDGPGGKSPQPRRSEPPKIRSGSVTDRVSGISLPIPEGWYGQQGNAGAQVTSEDSYKCPGDTSSTCTKGGAYSAPAVALGTKGATPEEIAKADIGANAEESYGGKSYGGITQHDVLASRAVTVAGQKGYLVRWKAVTSKGADGIVESLAFPSPANAKLMVVVRFGVDADQKERVLDDITEGIKVSTGSGNGQDV